MKLKLDENLPHELTAALRGEGHDVHTVADEQLAGESDPVIVVEPRKVRIRRPDQDDPS